ncbi:MAG TPA: cation:proton antiporter [Steroidobacteraceae bacterium]|nr:cation:proton antiporter [Steroidobacteraceae bacterium]HRX89420.1 cation:proton antiporter [Steroidobacteraceae bacterium]
MQEFLTNLAISQDVAYILLLTALFVVPRVLQRWNIPSAVTAFALGAAAGLGLGWFQGDSTVGLLSTLGIVALFLFAGLEVDFGELRRGAGVLIQHVVIRLAIVATVAWIVHVALPLDLRPAILVSLALVTPSTGFILDSLDALGSTDQERFWIRSKAIAIEIVALGILFVDLRSETWQGLALSTAALFALIAFLPLAFSFFAKRIMPHAPKSDFPFLVILAVAAAFVTKNLGVYYLVGAFVVGIVAHRFREHIPSMRDHSMLHAVGALSSLFVPFYFFHAGLELQRDDFSLNAVLFALIFLVTVLPFRLLVVGLHRRVVLKEPLRTGLRVSVPMLPTLVFTLVLASILREEFQIDAAIFGALVIYALVNTMLPSFILRSAPPAYDDIHVTAIHGPPAPPVSVAADRRGNSPGRTNKVLK